MKKMSVFKLFPMLLLVLITAAFMSACGGKNSFELSVMITESKAFTITSENPVKVGYGESVSFDVELTEGLDLIDVLDGEKSVNYTYENGVLVVKNITSPATLRIISGDSSKKVVYEVFSTARRGGGVSPSVGRVQKGEEVTFRASPNNGAVFHGWSEGKSLADGGKLLSREEQFTMKLSNDINIYANYDDSGVPKIVRKEPNLPVVEKPNKDKYKGEYTMPRNELVEVIYYANGGVTSDGSDSLVTDFCIDYHEMINTLPDNGKFFREGYVLVGYNTENDGSGEYVGMGHKFNYTKDGATVLYCMWEKETPITDFSFSLSDGENKFAILNKYSGNAKNVYIPKYYDGLPVISISENAFSGNGVSYVYIPSTVRSVAPNAFSDCKSLSEITFFDSVVSMPDSCFAGTTIKKVNIHAASLPRYPDNDLSFAKKYERFAAHTDKPRLIIVSGSSKHFGFDSDYAYELLGEKFNVVNYGNNAQMNVVFFLEALSNLANKGDYILYAPEQYGPYCFTVNGNPEMTALTFQGCESCYNLVSYVDVSKYTKFFDFYTQYASQRVNMREKSYESRSYNIDEYGDCSIKRDKYNSDGYRNGANGTFYFKADTIPVEFAANVNRILSVAKERGVKTCIGYPPYNINACDPATLTDQGYDSYNADMMKVLDAPLISDVRNYIMQGKYFYNTDYHLMQEGATMHTEQVIADFVAFVESES